MTTDSTISQHTVQKQVITQEFAPLQHFRIQENSGSSGVDQHIACENSSISAMNLGDLNFESPLLNSITWNDTTETNSRTGSDAKEKKKRETKSSSLRQSSPTRLDASSWDGQMALLSNFEGIEYDTSGSQKEADAGVEPAEATVDVQEAVGSSASNAKIGGAHSSLPVAVSETASLASVMKEGETSSLASRATSTQPSLMQNAARSRPHPMAIQSSATCPPHSINAATGIAYSDGTVQSGTFFQIGANGITPTQSHQTHNMFGLQGVDSAAVASLAASYENTTASTAVNPNTTNRHLHSLAANFYLAQSGANVGQMNQQSHTTSSPVPNSSSHNPKSVSNASSAAHSGSSASSSSTSIQPNQRQPQHRQGNSTTSTASSSASKAPPFYLFDAPVELRANFMQNQRKLGLPIQHDPNSYHFGETVKGFHPQQLLNQQQANAIARNGHLHHIPPAPVKLIDARHGNIKSGLSGRVKNEREQKRAQKITELIEQLRLNMESGGWKVEMRSKFHTLSQCAEYVKHMIKTMKEKEEAVKKLKSDLKVKHQKIEEDKAAQESRSDPESVTSSLTSDTTGSHSNSKSDSSGDNDAKNRKDTIDGMGEKKCHNNDVPSHNISSISINEDSSGGGEDRGSGGSGSGEPGTQSFSVDKTAISSVSDMTDSNRASSSNNSGSGSGSGKTASISHASANDADDEGQPSTSSISSDAAVASEKSSRDRHNGRHHHNHKDVVFNTEKRSERKRPPEEVTSLERNFELNYKEVFTMSNIPQLIASTSGKIITWNQCFLKVTGLRKSEVERMTIFSLVRPENLPNFFEIAAHALKPQEEERSNVDSTDESTETIQDDEKTSEGENQGVRSNESSRRLDYAALTLPCIEFPAMKNRRDQNYPLQNSDSLHVTVMLMPEQDPRKRCFHCVFTNCPGTNGALGIITPGLLASLFDGCSYPRKRIKRHHRHHKRMRSTKETPSSSKNDTSEQTESTRYPEEESGGSESCPDKVEQSSG